MPPTVTGSSNGRITIVGVLDIYSVEAVHRSLLEKLPPASPIKIDLSGVTACDAAGAQLLWCLHRETSRRGQTLTALASVPPSVAATFNALGLPSPFAVSLPETT